MRKRYLMLIPAIAAPLLLESCQTWGPTWSEITGARYNVTIIESSPGDHRHGRQPGRRSPIRASIKVTPGEHRLVVQGPAPGWPGGPPLHVMMLNAEPCKRYYINAQFSTTITQEWTPVVDYVEQIAGCLVPAAK